MASEDTKSTHEAKPEGEGERVFFCHGCKKMFAESEASDVKECPECGGDLDLHDDPSWRESA